MPVVDAAEVCCARLGSASGGLREAITPSRKTRILRLAPLAPGIVEAFLDGRPGPRVTLARLMAPFR